jgi:hypothetical protein
LSYDRRERGTVVEADPAEALGQIIWLKAAVYRWDVRSMDDAIRVTSLIGANGETVTG